MSEEKKMIINEKDFVACNYFEACDYYKSLKRLQKENEKLKANKGRCAFKSLDNTFCDEAKIRIDKLELDKDCLNVSLETARKYRGIAETDRDKYKQALEEIREIAKHWLNNDWSCYHCRNNMDEKLKEIIKLTRF